jgi:holo-[acyl-carrier protein] synthase
MIVGIGVDIVEIGRMRRALERQGDRFLKRVFTPAEQEYCSAHRDPVPHYAARFAAKEAVFKALGTGWARGVSWLDVEVRRRKENAPTLVLNGEAERHSLALGVGNTHLSLSHSDEAAVALVVLEK